jgi:hypothetical protein
MSSHSVAMKDHFFYLRHKLPHSVPCVSHGWPVVSDVCLCPEPETSRDWTLGGSGPERAGAPLTTAIIKTATTKLPYATSVSLLSFSHPWFEFQLVGQPTSVDRRDHGVFFTQSGLLYSTFRTLARSPFSFSHVSPTRNRPDIC